MTELLVIQEALLKPRMYVYFTAGWKPVDWANKFFEVEACQQIPLGIWKIINVGSTYELKFFDQGLIPDNPVTMFEILTGLKGNTLLFPRLPSTDYFLKLEKAGKVPDPTDADRRYLGCYVEEDSPYGCPKIREYTVKDMEPPVYHLYCDSVEPEKVVTRHIVNRCKMVEPNADTLDLLKKKKLPYREIPHYTVMKW